MRGTSTWSVTLPKIDVTNEVETRLGYNVISGNQSTGIAPDNIRWDCSIGSLPFLFAFNDQRPFQRETSDFRRQRVDTERNPGEQSLDSGYWIRSQSSWHYGEGLTTAEPLEVSDTEARFRYQRGGGVNPWTAGQLSLLHDTTLRKVSAGSSQLLLGVDTGVIHADASTVTYLPLTGASAGITWGGSASVQSLTSNGASWFAGASAGIYSGSLPSGSGTHIYSASGQTLVRWAKSRLMATVDASVYEITNLSPSATPAALPTPLFTSPASGWKWTDIAEGPTAIYLSGYTGDTSTIYKVAIDATTTTVSLSQPVVVAEMPRGEIVYSLYSYVGTYLVVGTSKGVRVASMESNGSLTLGPVLISTSDGVKDTVAVGSYVFVTVGSKGEAGDRVQRPGLYRIDLGTNLNNSALQFAHAADLVAPSGTTGYATQVTTAGGKLWFSVDSAGVFSESDGYVSTGWIETGRIRMGTVESKAWRDLRLLASEGSAGVVTAFASSADSTAPSNWSAIISLSGSILDSTGLLNAAFPSPAANLYAAFELTRDASTGGTPLMSGYQLRSVPAPRRSQLLSVPLLMFDYELARDGVRYGQKNAAYDRFQMLKDLERSSSTVVWRDYTTGEVAEAYIERVSYARTTPPTRSVGGNGGICTVLLRLV